MASLHTDRAFNKAQSMGAAAASDFGHWNELMSMPKRALAEIAMHLAAVTTGHYDDAIHDGEAFERVIEEAKTLKNSGLI